MHQGAKTVWSRSEMSPRYQKTARIVPRCLTSLTKFSNIFTLRMKNIFLCQVYHPGFRSTNAWLVIWDQTANKDHWKCSIRRVTIELGHFKYLCLPFPRESDSMYSKIIFTIKNANIQAFFPSPSLKKTN